MVLQYFQITPIHFHRALFFLHSTIRVSFLSCFFVLSRSQRSRSLVKISLVYRPLVKLHLLILKSCSSYGQKWSHAFCAYGIRSDVLGTVHSATSLFRYSCLSCVIFARTCAFGHFAIRFYFVYRYRSHTFPLSASRILLVFKNSPEFVRVSKAEKTDILAQCLKCWSQLRSRLATEQRHFSACRSFEIISCTSFHSDFPFLLSALTVHQRERSQPEFNGHGLRKHSSKYF